MLKHQIEKRANIFTTNRCICNKVNFLPERILESLPTLSRQITNFSPISHCEVGCFKTLVKILYNIGE